jgi:ribosomal protein L7/L12
MNTLALAEIVRQQRHEEEIERLENQRRNAAIDAEFDLWYTTLKAILESVSDLKVEYSDLWHPKIYISSDEKNLTYLNKGSLPAYSPEEYVKELVQKYHEYFDLERLEAYKPMSIGDIAKLVQHNQELVRACQAYSKQISDMQDRLDVALADASHNYREAHAAQSTAIRLRTRYEESEEKVAYLLEESGIQLRTVLLTGYGGKDTKVATIREIKSITGLGLKDAKDLVDVSPENPQIVKADLTPLQAQEIVERLRRVGATTAEEYEPAEA